MSRIFDLLALSTLISNRDDLKRILPDEAAYLAATESSGKVLDLLRTEHPNLSRLDTVRMAVTLVRGRTTDDAKLAIFMAGALDWFENDPRLSPSTPEKTP